MARFGVNATYNLWIRTLKPRYKTYFSANIRLVRRLFAVNVCYHYTFTEVYYYEYLGSVNYGRNVTYEKYWLKDIYGPRPYMKFHFGQNFKCRFGDKYPSLTVKPDGFWNLTYYKNINTTGWFDWYNRRFDVTRVTNGEWTEFNEEIDEDNYEFNNCFELIDFMLKKAKYFEI